VKNASANPVTFRENNRHSLIMSATGYELGLALYSGSSSWKYPFRCYGGVEIIK